MDTASLPVINQYHSLTDESDIGKWSQDAVKGIAQEVL